MPEGEPQRQRALEESKKEMHEVLRKVKDRVEAPEKHPDDTIKIPQNSEVTQALYRKKEEYKKRYKDERARVAKGEAAVGSDYMTDLYYRIAILDTLFNAGTADSEEMIRELHPVDDRKKIFINAWKVIRDYTETAGRNNRVILGTMGTGLKKERTLVQNIDGTMTWPTEDGGESAEATLLTPNANGTQPWPQKKIVPSTKPKKNLWGSFKSFFGF